jgi:hypothetical protein
VLIAPNNMTIGIILESFINFLTSKFSAAREMTRLIRQIIITYKY